MRFLATLRSLANSLFHRADIHREMEEEMRAHMENRADDLVRSGIPRAEAERRARIEFGGQQGFAEECRDAIGANFFETILQDVRFGLRMLRKSPGFTTVTVLTLALGIGANTALFSFVDAVLVRSLPVERPGELIQLSWECLGKRPSQGYDGYKSSDRSSGREEGTSFPLLAFERIRDNTQTLAGTFAFAPIEQLNVFAGGHAEIASGQYVSGNYYGVLGVQALRGRVLNAADDRADAEPAAVITWNYWQRRFGGDPRAIGMKVSVNNVPLTIVGVTRPEFLGTLQIGQSADVTLPLAAEPLLEPASPDLRKPALWWLRIMGRLKPSTTREQVKANMEAVYQQSVMDAFNASIAAGMSKPRTFLPRDSPSLLVNSGAQGEMNVRLGYREPFALLTAVVGLVLLIACVNVANLMLSRGAARRQEMAMRLALGSGRFRLIRQLLTESLILSILAGCVGTILAYWGKDILVAWSPLVSTDLHVALDVRVLGFTMALTLLTGVLFGLAPAIRASGTELTPALKIGIATGHARPRSMGAQALVIAQVAMSLVLLLAAGLFVRTLRNLHSVDVGFNRANLLIFRVNPQPNGYKAEQMTDLFGRILERLRAVPGATGVALSRHPLLSQSRRFDSITIPGATGEEDRALTNVVSPGFFETMQIPIALGRSLNDHDTGASQRVVVVNEAFVRKYFATKYAIGQRFWIGARTQPPVEIVGVARDAKYTGVRDEIVPTIYEAYSQDVPLQASFEVRFTGNESAVLTGVRAAIRQVDDRLPIYDIKTQMAASEDSIAQERLFASLATVVSSFALILAAIGLYGTMSYAVHRRTQEIGIRMALGARQRSVMWMVLRETLALVALGIAVGVPLALASVRLTSTLLSQLLFGVAANDSVILFIAAAVLALVALFAGYIPARRAMRVDPMIALRNA